MKRLVKHLLTSLCVVAFFPAMAMAVESYKFERMFPVLQQPWYSISPSGLATDSKGFIYIVDMNGNNIQKFTSDGFFVTRWGKYGNKPDEFYQPTKIVIDDDDYLYVTDSLNHSIKKFNSDGKLIDTWGVTEGTDENHFSRPKGIAIDRKNKVIYVADSNNYRIKKLDMNGNLLGLWGKNGNGDGEFQDPRAVAVDSQGYVYVADGEKDGVSNHRIQKFDSDGKYIFQWGTKGSGDYEFIEPSGIFIDKNDNIYVADANNHRIKIFNTSGMLIATWGDIFDKSKYAYILDKNASLFSLLQSFFAPQLEVFQPGLHINQLTQEELTEFLLKDGKDGTFNKPLDIVADNNGNIYVADSVNQRIQKFTPQKELLSVWGSTSSKEGMFKNPVSMASDAQYIYVTDSKNHRIQRFTKDGRFAGQWGEQGSGDGTDRKIQFQFPTGIAVKDNLLYVADSFNHRIHKLIIKNDNTLEHSAVWGNKDAAKGTEDGKFYLPLGVAVDDTGNVYVTDLFNFRIQKFNSDGNHIATWGALPWNLNFMGATGIAVDGAGSIYIANSMKDCVQKFDSAGNKIGKDWTEGLPGDKLKCPFGITVKNGFVYVADTGKSCIRQFTTDGVFVQNIGKPGSSLGEFIAPVGITVDSERIYVADSGNNRIQVFRKGLDTDKKMKAIIVAGRRLDNSIWNETQMNANFAYRALMYQGFSKDSIYYLSSNTELDLDNDGIPEVRAKATGNNLQTAITEWAKDADSLVLYFVDHGGDGRFIMGTTDDGKTEYLYANQLNGWLNTAQQTIPGTVTFVYDACYSGSFLSALKPPDGKKRIVISSASEKEEASFTTDGSTAFSSYFWTHIFNGATVGTAFNFSRKAMGYLTTSQNALIDDNGDGISDNKDGSLAGITYIGNGTAIYANAPKIGAVSGEQTIHIEQTTSADIAAYNVTSPDNNNIVHVWAVIRPPDYQPTAGNPVTDLPSVDLSLISAGNYKVTYNEFKTPGTYYILVYARDDKGYTSEPSQAVVTVESPLRHKAIIVAGIQPDDKWRAAVEKSVQMSYNALKFQKYSDDDIYLMSPISIAEVSKMPTQPTPENLRNAISALTGDNTQDLVLYMIGNGADGAFKINSSETLMPAELNTWLNDLQTRITGKVIVVYDACRAESFAQHLTWNPDKTKRIVIASTRNDQSAHFMTEGGVSFSGYFWNKIWDGATVWEAFDTGKKAFNIVNAPISCKPQNPYLDDTGDGKSNTMDDDGIVAEISIIGAGIRPGDSPPTVSDAGIVLIGKTSGIIRADVTGSGSISKVWAAIDVCTLPAVPDIPITELSEKTELAYNPVSMLYEGKYDSYSDKCQIFVYAADVNGNISLPVLVKTVSSASAPSVVSIKCSPASAEFTVTFSEIVSGIDISDFALVKTGTANGTIASVSASSEKSVTVKVNNITGSGTLGLNLADDDSIVSAFGIPLGGAGAGNGNFTGEVYSIDKIAPVITSITSSTPNGTYGSEKIINVTVNFSEPVTLSGGNLIVNLDSGGQAVISPFGMAISASGNYMVANGQNSADLNSISLSLASGAILKNSADNALTDFNIPAGQSLKDSKAIVINTAVVPPITVTLISVSNTLPYIASATATGIGISERGFYWWIPPTQETHFGGSDSGLLPDGGSGAENFSLNLTGLKAGNTYHVKAYVKLGEQIITSGELIITAKGSGAMGKIAPTVLTDTKNFTVSGSSITVSGEITDVGSTPVNVYGFIYAPHTAPFTGDDMLKTGDRAYAMWDKTPLYQGMKFTGTIKTSRPENGICGRMPTMRTRIHQRGNPKA